jgi:hypothetical protein
MNSSNNKEDDLRLIARLSEEKYAWYMLGLAVSRIFAQTRTTAAPPTTPSAASSPPASTVNAMMTRSASPVSEAGSNKASSEPTASAPDAPRWPFRLQYGPPLSRRAMREALPLALSGVFEPR